MVSNLKIGVVVVAAGSGSRYGADRPKQFLPLDGRPVLCHCLDAFRKALPKAPVVLVLSKIGTEIWNTYCSESAYASPTVVEGGTTRAESVLKGLTALRSVLPGDAAVMVHDGARPLLSQSLIERLMQPLDDGFDGTVPALTMTDSMVIRRSNSDFEATPRTLYRRVQTPQVFKLQPLIDAYSSSDSSDFTDECSAMSATKGRFKLVDGDAFNIKITSPGDILKAESLMHSACLG